MAAVFDANRVAVLAIALVARADYTPALIFIALTALGVLLQKFDLR